MTETKTEFENQSSAAAGIYRQNAFYIRMESIFDLEPSDSEPVPYAVAMHVHEYVHFLHNISTTAGQAYLVANLIFLRALAGGSDDQGHFLSVDRIRQDDKGLATLTAELMRAQLGTTSVSEFSRCRDPNAWTFRDPEIKKSGELPSTSCAICARSDNGAEIVRIVEVGLGFITEGVAYEVEREIRRQIGMADIDLDTHTKAFPYLVYGALVRSWSGRDLSSRDCIAIGVAALAHKFSGFGLAKICRQLKATSLSIDEVLAKANDLFSEESREVMELIRIQRRDLGQGDVIWTAMGEYMKLAEAGVRLRQKGESPELALLARALNPEAFRECISEMIDCLVIQRKPGGALDMYWMGPGVAAIDDESTHRLGALQSSLHFSQLHIATDGSIIPTRKVPQCSCPFAGGCEVERRDGYPQECKSSPWTRFTPSSPGDMVCWYAAGVKALRNPSHVQ